MKLVLCVLYSLIFAPASLIASPFTVAAILQAPVKQLGWRSLGLSGLPESSEAQRSLSKAVNAILYGDAHYLHQITTAAVSSTGERTQACLPEEK